MYQSFPVPYLLDILFVQFAFWRPNSMKHCMEIQAFGRSDYSDTNVIIPFIPFIASYQALTSNVNKLAVIWFSKLVR